MCLTKLLRGTKHGQDTSGVKLLEDLELQDKTGGQATHHTFVTSLWLYIFTWDNFRNLKEVSDNFTQHF